MKYNYILLLLLAFFVFSGCEAIAGIFNAGVWVGVIIVVLVIVLILFLVNRGKKK
ncbi:MAG: phosphatidate cytidylyltransferase [Chitinophagales bacterium]|nr:phosphatidate cytidylyltransferase [Chitinophagales bacterium]